jgi:hypothetical protein
LRPHIINNSWGIVGDDPFFQAIVDAWVAAGIFPVFAVGNSGSACNSDASPANYGNSYGVGAFGSDGAIAGFSSRGSSSGEIKPNIAAPGVGIRSAWLGSTYQFTSGTSMAAPHVAGTAALIWSAAPALIGDIAGTRALLDDSAVDVEDLGCGGTADDNPVYGEGRLDAFAAVQSLARPPVTTASVSGTLVNGWYVDSATVSLSATDDSGVSTTSYSISRGAWTTYTQPFVVTGNGAIGVSFFSEDVDGNIEETKTITINIDGADPLVTLTTPADGAGYALEGTILADYACVDPGGSGIASCVGTAPNGSPIDTSSLGSHSFSVTAADNVGKTSTETVRYIVQYPFEWRLPGIQPAPSMNQVQAGDPLYLRFSLGGDYGLDVLEAGSPLMQTISCSSGAPLGSPLPLPAIGELRYLSGGYYQIIWRTRASWEDTCRQVVLALNDGTEQRLNFQFAPNG